MTAWSVILELDTDNPDPVRKHIVEDLRTLGYQVRSKTILTAQLAIAVKPPPRFSEVAPTGNIRTAYRTGRVRHTQGARDH